MKQNEQKRKFDNIFDLKLQTKIVPTIKERYNNCEIIIVFKDGSFIHLDTENCDENKYDSKEEYFDLWLVDREEFKETFKNVTNEELGITISKNLKNVTEVYVADL